ncbi:glycosyltransferase [Streptomyces sp. FXJ1.172]|uniref:glycosyltransferase n=1 Tax=Streptomyces sp. FXJ1.172 TaxID=710705 RepID=UPI0007D0235E|nr:glycosyltransferase [Streptomyces sp. FXJ1.172]WEO93520.1 glycosyltransferase [Streptomyces sp. FXJ1.172]
MRVLVTVTGSPSHVNAVLPLVSALATVHHQVLVAAPARLLALFDGLPLQREPLLTDPLARFSPQADGPPERRALDLFAGAHLIDSYRALLPAARAFAPALVIRDGGEFTGYLVAETLGLPHLAAPSGAANHLDPVVLQPQLNQRRAALGLRAEDDPDAIHRHGRLDCMPAEFSFARHRTGTLYRYRQPSEIHPGDVLPDWVAELPSGRPLVLATIGTVLPSVPSAVADAPGLVNAIVTALAELDCQAVVATGGVAVDRPRAAGRVHVVDSVPQPLLLRCTQLLVTHGGYNSIREAVGAGVPMAVLPCFGDQPDNADRVQELGLGRRIPSPEETAAVCHQVLNDPEVTARTRHAQRRMLCLPPIQAAVDDLEKVAGGGA